MQICAPRPIQLALGPLLQSFRPFLLANARSIQARHDLFKSVLPPRWKIGTQGGFFAFVKHPFKGVSATEVSRRLAKDIGVVTLPAEFFCQAKEAPGDECKSGEQVNVVTPGDDEMWIRFSVANVDDEMVRKVCERLSECETSFDWEVEPLPIVESGGVAC